ncbi:Hypothetical predicted protein [Olea europaea subsp. europaea]|uniref:Uncharacterized protein n=1 Tax=Olea europaea subsp. europaea TaxID=158383 RepID=A0A8S0R035_OLEEU|nr:Hypothetical predicted protein [Olea europaea subsp. europaea]
MNGGKNDVEVPVGKSDKSVGKSDKAMKKSDKALEMNLNEEIEFHENGWLKVDDIVTHSLAKNQEHVASPSDKVRAELLGKEFELKDEVWEKIVEVTAMIEAEIEIEEENIETIDDVTLDMPLKRQKKPIALLHSPLDQ